MFYEAEHDFGTCLINLDSVSSIVVVKGKKKQEDYCRISLKNRRFIPVKVEEYDRIKKILL